MATQVISGADGIIEVASNEVPCLREWTLQTSANINTEQTKCMKSNGDGGSTSSGGWDAATLTSKAWTGEFTFFWQETDEGASPDLDLTDVGKSIAIKVYPHLSTSGKVEYSGTGIIANVSLPSNVDGNIQQTVSVTGDGALVRALVTP